MVSEIELDIPEDNVFSVDDPVNHPNHYNDGKIEVIDFIEDKKLSFNLGNVCKYICRGKLKNGGKDYLQDLEKARFYLNREISLVKKGCD